MSIKYTWPFSLICVILLKDKHREKSDLHKNTELFERNYAFAKKSESIVYQW